VFRELQRRITGWPGGKPPEAKSARRHRRPTDAIFPKRVLIVSALTRMTM
jgi:glucosamine-6-phosphate deaminase